MRQLNKIVSELDRQFSLDTKINLNSQNIRMVVYQSNRRSIIIFERKSHYSISIINILDDDDETFNSINVNDYKKVIEIVGHWMIKPNEFEWMKQVQQYICLMVV